MSNTTIVADVFQLTKDDLIDEYEKLADAHRQLKLSEDAHLQHIHELKRSLQTATNAETYLAAELETITSVHNAEIAQLRHGHETEMEAARKKHADALDTVVGLEGELEAMRNAMEPLRQTVQDLQSQVRAEPKDDVEQSVKVLERLSKTEEENGRLIAVVESVREQLHQSLKQIVQNERRIEDLCDQLECAQSTLDSKRDELDEKTQLFDTAQERICQLSGELAALQNIPETDTQKRGNSLFAEVDDQRQEMRIKFAAQKKHYMQMKLEYDQSHQEIRSLKRENAAMHKELQICSSLFLNADKTYKEKLNERIGQLLGDNQKLDSKLRCTESMLVSMGNEHGVTWLDSMLTFCKNETNEMRETLKTCRLQKSNADELLHNVTQDLARWRFEALKSRCVIINRETLLEEHKIQFDTDAAAANISNMARKLDTSSVRPIIVDASTSILRVTSDKVAALQTNQPIIVRPIGDVSTCEKGIKVERISVLPRQASDDMDIEHDVRPSCVLASNEERSSMDAAECKPIDVKIEVQSAMPSIKVERIIPAPDNHSNDVENKPPKNQPIIRSTIKVLESNQQHIKSERSRLADVIVAKPSKVAKTVQFQPIIDNRIHVIPDVDSLLSPKEEEHPQKPVFSGIMRRVMVKSKKPTVFPD